jgi:HD-GYP domain-containing protein (c-di-GMP phosphodiesterase class II)
MRIKIEEIQEGCILSEDVYSLTNRPIVNNKTVLTADIIKVLKAFLIKEIAVEKLLVSGSPITLKEKIEEGKPAEHKAASFEEIKLEELFLMGAKEFKSEFKNWQSGLPVDISKIRGIMLPLVEKSLSFPSEIFFLHRLSNEAEYLYQHSIAVGLLSAFIGKKLGFKRGDIAQLAIGGCLSDSGMAKIKPDILNKTSQLSEQEFEEIKKHTAYSYKMVQSISLLRDSIKIGIFQHHERLDGSGYPFGERGNKINRFARIIAVADTFHAMTSNRLYRQKQSPFKVLEMMMQDMFGKYDIQAMQALGSGIMTFSIGSKVKLSDGQVAEIIFIDDKSPTRPLVKLIKSEEILHLEKNRQLFIEEIIK